MKWQDAAAILVVLIGIGGAIGYSDLFGVLFELTGVEYTYTGDQVCGDTCESYINVTTSYWRVCFNHYNGTKYEDETLFKKVSRSRTLHVNLDNVDNVVSTDPRIEVDWMVPTYGKNWRPLKDGDCWERKKVNRIKLVGHKEEWQDVKWTFAMEDPFNSDYNIDIDPKWGSMDLELLLFEDAIYSEEELDAADSWGEPLEQDYVNSTYVYYGNATNYDLYVDYTPICAANNGPDGYRDCSLGVRVIYKDSKNIVYDQNFYIYEPY